MNAAAATMRVILLQGEQTETLSGIDRFALVKALLEKGYSVSCVAKLQTATAGKRVVVLSRSADQGSVETRDGSLHVVSLEDPDPRQAAEAVDSVRAKSQLPEPGGWKPWFPVIDYQRCTNCMQCLSFCLFDVYGVSSEGKIQVQNNDNCKTDCPACSRVCPEVAIMFPKYRHGPINGDEVNSDDLRREAMKVDISALLGGDIYKLLRDRSAKAKSRFSKERDDERALKERQKCFRKLQQELQIPPEVLAALPGTEEIRAKAEAAQARTLAAGSSREKASN